MKPFIPIKKGLIAPDHIKRMGDSVWVFMYYLSLMGAHRDKVDPIKNEICVMVYPTTMKKILDIPEQDLSRHNERLVKEGYIELHDLTEGKDKYLWVICIKKSIL